MSQTTLEVKDTGHGLTAVSQRSSKLVIRPCGRHSGTDTPTWRTECPCTRWHRICLVPPEELDSNLCKSAPRRCSTSSTTSTSRTSPTILMLGPVSSSTHGSRPALLHQTLRLVVQSTTLLVLEPGNTPDEGQKMGVSFSSKSDVAPGHTGRAANTCLHC